MFLVGLLASFFMGGVLSFLGAGGSILTLPILVYLFKINAKHTYFLGVASVFTEKSDACN